MKKSMSIEFTSIPANETAPANLTVVFPGLIGNVVDQTSPVIDTMTRHGATLLVQPRGDHYDAQKLAADSATKISQHLRTGEFDAITFTGLSMGGSVAADTIGNLGRNDSFSEYSALPRATLVDAPSGIEDLAGLPLALRNRPKLAARALKAMGAMSPILDKMPVIAMMTPPPKGDRFEEGLTGEQLAHIGEAYRRMTETRFGVWRDQVESLATRESPAHRSLDCLASLAYIRSLHGDDVVVAENAIRTWGRTVGSTSKFAIIKAEMPHVAFDQAPRAGNKAILDAYAWHETRSAYSKSSE